jgi:hypothetical protein
MRSTQLMFVGVLVVMNFYIFDENNNTILDKTMSAETLFCKNHLDKYKPDE